MHCLLRQAAAGDSNAQDLTVIPGDYRLGAILLGVGAFLGLGCHLGTQGFLHTLLGGFLSFQASRVRFRFSSTDLDVVFIEPGAADSTALQASTDSSGDNKLQGGGANKWALSSVTNWEFWWPGFPVLVYYKENQTQASGQPHFFPIIMNGKVLYETMLARMPPSVNPKPSPADWNLDTALDATSIGALVLRRASRDACTWSLHLTRCCRAAAPARSRHQGEAGAGAAEADQGAQRHPHGRQVSTVPLCNSMAAAAGCVALALAAGSGAARMSSQRVPPQPVARR